MEKVLFLKSQIRILTGEDLDDSEYDEEEDEDDDRPRKKKRKDRCSGFIIHEAEVDDEVEDEEEWEEGAQEIGIVGNEIDELGPTAREIEGRRRGTNLWEYVVSMNHFKIN